MKHPSPLGIMRLRRLLHIARRLGSGMAQRRRLLHIVRRKERRSTADSSIVLRRRLLHIVRRKERRSTADSSIVLRRRSLRIVRRKERRSTVDSSIVLRRRPLCIVGERRISRIPVWARGGRKPTGTSWMRKRGRMAVSHIPSVGICTKMQENMISGSPQGMRMSRKPA